MNKLFTSLLQKRSALYDLSIGSTETKYIKLNTKTQNIVCCVNENLYFVYTLWQGGQKNIKKWNVILKKWVLVFSFMYLVSVDPMDRSKIENFKVAPSVKMT